MTINKLQPETTASIKVKQRSRVDFYYAFFAVVFLVVMSYLLEIEFVESIYLFSRDHESWELDEIIFSFLWVAVVAIVYGIRRVLDIKTINKEIIHNAYYDSLTDLPNRSLALYQLEKSLHRAQRSPLSVAVIFLDLDNFKDINDSYGHSAGDLLIKLVGQRLSAVVRHDETVARLGGDEFLIIGEFEEQANVEVLLARIESCQNEPFDILGRQIMITFSIGVALSPHHGKSVKELLIAADSAMYEAKRKKSLTACYYSHEIGKRITERYQLSTQLKEAINDQQLFLVYQPIVCSSTGDIKGYEALTRWYVNDAYVNPELIISLAEDIGVSESFFKWLLNTALAESVDFIQQGQFIAINVSVRQFVDANFLANTRDIIAKHSNKLIEFEITESSLMSDFEEATGKIDALNDMGVNVMIDDFGTGYSSLSRLKHLNVDKIKIDRSFLNDADSDSDSNSKSVGIYQNIVALARRLDINVVAEGVETVEQLQFLNQFSPIYMQGYLFQKPHIKSEQQSAHAIKDIVYKASQTTVEITPR